MIIGLEGLISCGKSTLCNALDGVKYPEPLENENPFLTLFYANPERYAGEMQIFTLIYRYRQLKEAQSRNLNDPDTLYIIDRTAFLDYAFERVNHKLGNITDQEDILYRMAHETLQEQIYFPDLILYLKAEPELCLKRLHERARGCEVGVTIDYLKALQREYDHVMQTLSRKCPIVVIDAEQSKEAVLKQAKEAIEKRRAELNAVWPRWKGGF